MRRSALAASMLIALAACGEAEPEPEPQATASVAPEVYPGLESLEPDPSDPVPAVAPGDGLLLVAETLQFIGQTDQARVWVGRQLPQMTDEETADYVCIYAEIGDDSTQASIPCTPAENFLASSITIFPSANHEWVEIYVVPDGFGDVTVPGLERVTPNLFVGDTRESAPPGQTVTGTTGSFQLVNDVPPSTA